MSYKIQKPIDLSSFGGRLLHLMVNKQENNLHICDTAPKLAALLLEAKLIKVNHRSRIKDEFFDDKDLARKAKESVIKQIQKHININDNDTRTVSGEYLMAYCTFFNCSADYLLGFTPIQTRDITTKQIYKKTGLSEQAVSNLRGDNQHSAITDISRLSWSRILESSLFFTIPQDLMTAENEAKEFFRHKAAIDAIHEITKDLDQSSPEYSIHTGKIKPLRKAADGHKAAYFGMLYKLSKDIIDKLDPLLEEKINDENYYDKKYKRLLRQFGGTKYATKTDTSSDAEQEFEFIEHFLLNPDA